ncbi:MAG: APC family permease [Patescibacteria group bacterium]|nr:APC family permease [Patescibacteria group bacterium]
MDAKDNSSKKYLSIGALALIGFAATDSLRNLPSMAVYGWASIFWYIAGTILFLIPLSLVAAELATTLPVSGGVYTWIRKAFGEHLGFLGIWCEWSENIVWFPAILVFIAATITYAIDPRLSADNHFLVMIMLITLWGLTIFNLFGARFSAFFSSFGSVTGTIIPQILLFTLAAVYIFGGNIIQVPFSIGALIPNFSLNSLPLLSIMITMFAGMELVGYHAREVKNPGTDYPKGILLACLLIFSLSIIGTMAIAIVVPLSKLNLAAGLMEAFRDFLSVFKLDWLMPIIAVLVAVGSLATVSTWMFGPARGLQVVAERGNLPRLFQISNRFDSPSGVLIIQAICGTVFILMFLFIPSVNASYWMMSALTSQILTVMYMLCFLSVLKLRYSKPELHRPFKIPGGKIGLWLTCGAGLFACLFVLFIGFIPPIGIPQTEYLNYILFMVSGFLILSCPPFIFMALKRKSWQKKLQENA